MSLAAHHKDTGKIIASIQSLSDDVIGLIFRYLLMFGPVEGDLVARCRLLSTPQLVCRRWKSIVHHSSLLWRDLYERKQWRAPSDGSYLNHAIDEHFKDRYIFFCRRCLLPLTAALTPLYHDVTKRELNRNPFPVPTDVPYHPEIPQLLEFNEKHAATFWLTDNSDCSCSHNYMKQTEEGEFDCIAVLSERALINITHVPKSGDTGCCGYDPAYGPNFRCAGCKVEDEHPYITAHTDCCPHQIHKIHMPLSCIWAVRVSRVCPGTLALAIYLNGLRRSLCGKIPPFASVLPLGPPKDALEKEREHYEFASQWLWNLCEPDHVQELIEDAADKKRYNFSTEHLLALVLRLTHYSIILGLRESGELDGDAADLIESAETHRSSAIGSGNGGGGGGKHKRVHNAKHIRTKLSHIGENSTQSQKK